jgi:nicotinamidase-related amidase
MDIEHHQKPKGSGNMASASAETQIDPKKSALLIIDVQRALFSRPTPIFNAELLLSNINSLIEMWRRYHGLIIFIQHSNNNLLNEGTPGWELHPDLDKRSTDILVDKLHGNAFEKTNLKDILDSKDIKEIVVTGLVTHGCVRATCIGAHNLGYRVILIGDGHSSYSKDAETKIKEWNQKLAMEGVELISTQNLFIKISG